MANERLTSKDIYMSNLGPQAQTLSSTDDDIPDGQVDIEGMYQGGNYEMTWSKALRNQKRVAQEMIRVEEQEQQDAITAVKSSFAVGKIGANLIKSKNEGTLEAVSAFLQEKLPSEMVELSPGVLTEKIGADLYQYSEAYKNADWSERLFMPATDQERGKVGTWVSKVFGDETPGIKEGRLTKTPESVAYEQGLTQTPAIASTSGPPIPVTAAVDKVANVAVPGDPVNVVEFGNNFAEYGLNPTTDSFNNEALKLLNSPGSANNLYTGVKSGTPIGSYSAQVSGQSVVLDSKAGQIFTQWKKSPTELSNAVSKRFNITKFTPGGSGDAIFYDSGVSATSEIGKQLTDNEVIGRIFKGMEADVVASSSVTVGAGGLKNTAAITANADKLSMGGKFLKGWKDMASTKSARTMGGINAAVNAYKLGTEWDEMDNDDKAQAGMQVVGGAMLALQILPGWGQAITLAAVIWDALDNDPKEEEGESKKSVYQNRRHQATLRRHNY